MAVSVIGTLNGLVNTDNNQLIDSNFNTFDNSPKSLSVINISDEAEMISQLCPTLIQQLAVNYLTLVNRI